MPELLEHVKLHRVDSTDDVASFLRWLGHDRPVLGWDLETTGLEWYRPGERIRTFQFGDTDTGWVFRYDQWKGVLEEVFSKYTGRMTGHNSLPFDRQWLRMDGVSIKRLHLQDDTLAMHVVTEPSEPHGLKPLADKYVDPRASILQAALEGGMKTHKWSWATVPFDFPPFWQYSALDGVLASHLWLEMQERGLRNKLHLPSYELEREVMIVYSDAAYRGVRVDLDHADAYSAELLEHSNTLLDRSMREYGVDPGKDAQVVEYFISQNLPLTKTTAGGKLALDKEVLDGLADKHPLAKIVLDYRQARKFRTAYVEKAKALAVNGRVHLGINATNAITGRSSISGLPVQQLPASDIGEGARRLIVPEPGNVLLSADQSNIEFRVLAHLSQERAAVRAFLNGEDIHQTMADVVFPGEEGGRKRVKTVTYAKLYGSGVAKMSVQLGGTEAHTRKIMSAYDKAFPGVKEFVEYVKQVGQSRYREEGRAYLNIPGGGHVELSDQDAQARRYYRLVNYLCQGFAARILKRDIVSLSNMNITDMLLFPVHDEVLLSVPAEDASEIGHAVQDTMNKEVGNPLDVPITSDVEIYSKSWGGSAPHSSDRRTLDEWDAHSGV